MAIGGPRRSRDGGLNVWPGYVDALSTLLMVIIFVLLVFVLAQGFLSVVLSSRDRALDRLNRQVAELAEMLSLERGETQTLRANLERASEEVRIATAARDLATELLRDARSEAQALVGERNAAQADRSRLAARIADLERVARGGGDRLDAAETALAEARDRGEAAGADAARIAARLTEAQAALATERQALVDAIGRVAAGEAQLADAARAREAAAVALRGAESRAAGLDRALAEARAALELEGAGRRQAVARAESAERDVSAGTSALAAERAARQAAEERAGTLDRQLAEARAALTATREELAALGRRAQDAQVARAETQRQLDAARADLATLDRQSRADRLLLETRATEAQRLGEQIRALSALRDQLERQAREAEARGGEVERRRVVAETEAREQARLGEAARAQVAMLGRQIEELRAQLGRVAAALDAAEAGGRDKDAQMALLGARLNAALAARVEELQRYRSDFFGRLREVLGDRPEVRIVGDRFVFQGEVLFSPAAAEPTERGREQIRAVGRVLAEIAGRIPPEVNWLLRVDGHADRNPIRGGRYASNWELSAARAIAVAQLLIADGLPRERVAAAAFGDNQPLDPAETPEALARNRRIELRLTDR